MTDQNEAPVEQPIDEWNSKFRELIHEAQQMQLSAPDVLFVLQRTCNEIQNQINSFVFNHSHSNEKE
jgi:hypothetical protein